MTGNVKKTFPSEIFPQFEYGEYRPPRMWAIRSYRWKQRIMHIDQRRPNTNSRHRKILTGKSFPLQYVCSNAIFVSVFRTDRMKTNYFLCVCTLLGVRCVYTAVPVCSTHTPPGWETSIFHFVFFTHMSTCIQFVLAANRVFTVQHLHSYCSGQ